MKTPPHLKDCLLKSGSIFGFDWAIGHNTMGFRTGYVLLPEHHVWRDESHDSLETNVCALPVHGGITYADNDGWIGFDCGHHDDAPDPSIISTGFVQNWPGGTIKDNAFVYGEILVIVCEAINDGMIKKDENLEEVINEMVNSRDSMTSRYAFFEMRMTGRIAVKTCSLGIFGKIIITEEGDDFTDSGYTQFETKEALKDWIEATRRL